MHAAVEHGEGNRAAGNRRTVTIGNGESAQPREADPQWCDIAKSMRRLSSKCRPLKHPRKPEPALWRTEYILWSVCIGAVGERAVK